jgi:hypothetical protein
LRGAQPHAAGRADVTARSQRGGFVLALVVMMLFAISVAGATGYLVVNSEFSMARHSDEGSEALAVARAGLHRFVAEQIGVVGDSVSYAVGGGVAMITTRKIAEQDSLTDLYFLRSEGTVVDPFTPGVPALRVVGAYAYHHRRPLAHHAAFMVTSTAAYAQNGGARIDGNDQNSAADCPGGNAADITGAIARTTTGSQSGGVLTGNPNGEQWSGGFTQMYDSVGLRWDVLSDPTFPVDFEGTPPNWGSLPSDSFPVVRYNGTFNGGGGWSGRGVLIVNGMFDAGASFTWNGIVLAGSIDDIVEAHVRGLVVVGLDGTNPYSTVYWRGTIYYYSCYVYDANESLSYLELLNDTQFEVY